MFYKMVPVLAVFLLFISGGCGVFEPPGVYEGKERDNIPAAIDSDFEPGYLKLHRSGELGERAKKLWEKMSECRLCPRECAVDRLGGESGFCRAPGTRLVISSAHGHFGEASCRHRRFGDDIFQPLRVKMRFLHKLADKPSRQGFH